MADLRLTSLAVEHGLADAGLEAVFVRAAGRGADAVDVGADRFIGRFGPLEGDFHLFAVVALDGERLLGDGGLLAVGDELGEEFRDTAGVGEVVRFAGDVVLERDLQAAVDVGHIFEVGFDLFGIEARGLKDVGVGLEGDDGAVAAKRADLLDGAGRFAALEFLLPLVAVSADHGDELLRQRVDDRRADAVQAAGVEIVAAFAELGAGVERGQDQFQGGAFELGVHINWDAAAVVGHGDRVAVLVQRDGDRIRVAIKVFIDGVIDDFPDEVVQALAVHAADVHGGAAADGFQAFEDGDVFGGVGGGGHIEESCFTDVVIGAGGFRPLASPRVTIPQPVGSHPSDGGWLTCVTEELKLG